MSYFTGEHECKIDDKGRMGLPARLKSVLPEGDETTVCLTRGIDKCIVLYTQAGWNVIADKLVQLDTSTEAARWIRRYILGGTFDSELDKAGRFLIPKHLFNWAGLEKDAVLVGVGDSVEIWSPERYQANLDDSGFDIAALAEQFLRPGRAAEEVTLSVSKAEQAKNAQPGA